MYVPLDVYCQRARISLSQRHDCRHESDGRRGNFLRTEGYHETCGARTNVAAALTSAADSRDAIAS